MAVRADAAPPCRPPRLPVTVDRAAAPADSGPLVRLLVALLANGEAERERRQGSDSGVTAETGRDAGP